MVGRSPRQQPPVAAPGPAGGIPAAAPLGADMAGTDGGGGEVTAWTAGAAGVVVGGGERSTVDDDGCRITP